jgi:lambda family phage tail tape measure protein
VAQNIQDLIVKLKAEGFEHIEKLKGSFRELNKVTNATESQIQLARKELLDLAKAAGNSEVANKGLIEAFKGLRSQVDLNGKTYQSLTAEITRMDSVLRGSTSAIDKQRAALLEHARTGLQNAESLQQQIDGLQRLQRQTRPGSEAFLQLGKDIDQATKNLGRFKSEASAAASTLTQMPATSLEKMAVQIGRLQGQMQKLNITSNDFLKYQQRIALIGTVRTRTESRQQVRALNAMYESEQYTKYAEGRAANLALPDTLAGIKLRISEINAELENITGYERRRALTIELKDLNRQLKNSIIDVVTQEDLALQRLRARVNAQREINQASGFRAFSQQVSGGEYDPAITKSIKRARQRLENENARLRKAANEAFNISNTPLLLPAAGGTSGEIPTGKTYGGGARLLAGQTEVTFGPSGLGRTQLPTSGNVPTRGRRAFIEEREALRGADFPSAAVGVAPAVAGKLAEQFDILGRSVERNRRPLRDIYVDIDKTTKASNGSINSLDAQIAVWTELRNAVGKTAPAFDTATKKLEQLSTQRERLGSRRRLTTGQAVQAGGAIISGGIFGGPEGFLGGLGGAALGSVLPGLGTVGGAFAGSAIGAQVGMFRQQLATVTDYSARIDKLQIALRGIVGSQDAYNTVLASAARVTKDLNIPQETVIQGMTRLSAAVLGAGGNVSDSTFAFGAITKAIKATGGSAEQADGAILALTQVFSKGKVSAEELNQIAERLPGTFTLFAKATGRTGPELLKALQDGKVGLNDLMKFLASIDTQYGQTALSVAKSTQEAGARVTIALQAIQLDVGRSLQPLGAALQSTFADFITTTAPAFIGAVKGISSAITFIVTDSVGKEFAKLSLYLGAATAAALLLKPAMLGIAAAMAFAKQQVIALTLAMARNPLTLLAIAASAAALRLAEAVLQQKGLNDEVERTLTLAGKQSPSSVAAQINATQEALRAARKKANPDLQTDYFGLGTAGPFLEVDRLEKKLVKLRQIYKARIEFETIFKGLDPRAGVPEGYKIVNGRLAYLSPGQGYVDAETGKPVRGSSFASQTDGLSTEDKNRLAQSYLQAYDQRAEALAKARQDREEAIAAIRKKAAEDLLTLERTLGDERRRIEYDIQDLRRKATATGEDINLLRRLQAGEDPRRIEAERKLLDIYRKSEEDRAQAEQQFNEEELAQARTIADYQKNIAKEIAAANETYNKRIGEAQKEFAKASAKIIEEGSGKAAKRLATAAEAIGIQLRIVDLQAIRIAAGLGSAPAPTRYENGKPVYERIPQELVPPELDKLYKNLNDVYKRLQSRGPAGSGATANRFTAALGGRGAGASLASISSDTYPLLAGLRVGDQVPFVQPTPIQVIPAAGATSGARQERREQQGINIDETQRKEILDFFIQSTSASRNLQRSLEDQNLELELQAKYLRSDISPELQRQLVNAEMIYQQSLDQSLIDAESALAKSGNEKMVREEYDKQVASAEALYTANLDLIAQGEMRRKQLEDMSKEFGPKFSASLKQYYESVTDLGTQIGGVVQSTFQGLEDQLTNFVTTGKVNFTDLANSILADMARIAIRQAIIAPLLQGIGSLFPGFGLFGGGPKAIVPGMPFDPSTVPGMAFAYGGVFAKNNVVPFAMGGIVKRPTFFAYANGGVPGTGLLGEAGPEAIMPLRRLPSGKLGVESTGGGAVTVNVSVDATGSQVQGDAGKSNQLGRAVAAAVQAELIKQKRPGGLLVS